MRKETRARGVVLRVRWLVALVPLLLAAPAARADDAQGSVVVDRVVAVVGRSIVLLSELRARMRPFVQRLRASGDQSESQREIAEQQIAREMLSKMIDDALLAREATERKITVTPAEIDQGVQSVAAANSMTPEQVYVEASAQGMSRAEYRDEVRRQILEGKLLQLRVLSRVRRDPKTTDAEWSEIINRERTAWLDELRRATYVDVRL